MCARKRKTDDIPLCEDPTVVAIDPGGTTGWSVLQVHYEALVSPDVLILRNILHWTHGQVVGDENEQAAELLGIIDGWPGACVLIEDFILRTANAGREVLAPVRITAKLEFGLYLVGASAFRQAPSEAKSVATDVRLKQWGLYQREGGLEHARDADRHGISWLRKCKQYDWLRRKCWPHLYGTPVAEDVVKEDEDIG